MDASPFSSADDGAAGDRREPSPPFVGGLLRMCWRRVRDRIRESVWAAGFTDLQDAHLALFSYPLPDGVRPSELARRLGASRQAANHLIGQMEALGYLERRSADGDRRLVHFTERGRGVGVAIFACLRDLEAEWAAEVGPERFDMFMHVLRLLAGQDPPAPSKSAA